MELMTFIWMFVVLKIPILAALALIWWAVRQEPGPVDEDDGGTPRPDPHRGPNPPRPPRRGPHSGAPLPSPPRVRVPATAPSRTAPTST